MARAEELSIGIRSHVEDAERSLTNLVVNTSETIQTGARAAQQSLLTVSTDVGAQLKLTSAEVERALSAVGTGAANSILTSARDAQSTLVTASSDAASQIKSLSADVERTLSSAGNATAAAILNSAREVQSALVTASLDATNHAKSLATSNSLAAATSPSTTPSKTRTAPISSPWSSCQRTTAETEGTSATRNAGWEKWQFGWQFLSTRPTARYFETRRSTMRSILWLGLLLTLGSCASTKLDPGYVENPSIKVGLDPLKLEVCAEPRLLRVDLVRATHTETRNRTMYGGTSSSVVSETVEVSNPYHYVALDFGNRILMDYNHNLFVDLNRFYALDKRNPDHSFRATLDFYGAKAVVENKDDKFTYTDKGLFGGTRTVTTTGHVTEIQEPGFLGGKSVP